MFLVHNCGTQLAGKAHSEQGTFPASSFYGITQVSNKKQFLATFFDGLCGAVIGVIGVIAAQILQASVHASPTSVDKAAQSAAAACLYLLALVVLYKFTNKWTPLLLLACGAIAGQFLFV